jgi:tetratricopeptide (TPR) repeat protein
MGPNKNLFQLLTLLLFLFTQTLLNAQQVDKKLYEKNFYRSLDYIYEENYDKALAILYELDSLKAPQFLKNSENFQFFIDSQFINIEQVYVKYLIAVCHLEKNGDPQTALPYIEYVLESGYSNTPTIIYKDLGRLYYLDYQFAKAIYYFNKYLEKVSNKDEFYGYTKMMINASLNAQSIIKDTIYSEISGLRGNINNEAHDEINVVVNFDGTILYFEKDSLKKNRNQIMLSRNEFGIWTKSKILEFPNSFMQNAQNIRIAGMDFEQENLLIYKDTPNESSVYLCKISGDKVIELQPLNYSFLQKGDGRISFGKNNKEIYFSSSRAGGKGGYDIYKIDQKHNGTWDSIVNLEVINTALDEIDPFFNRKNMMLYFSSSSYQSMGGFDIFMSPMVKNKTGNAQNIGFAINTVGNNRSFTTSTTNNLAFYSSNQKRNIRLHDLYSVKLNESIPLTLLNGTFQAGNPPKPVNLKLSVIETSTKEKIKYSFTSQKALGKYFIIFEPGKVYDLLFEAEGYKPQKITIEVPKQEYFYQIFQSISLQPFTDSTQLEAAEITVKNNFYDLGKLANDSITGYLSEMQNLFYDVSGKIDSINSYVKQSLNQETEESNGSIGAESQLNDLLLLIENSIINTDTATINQLFEKSEKTEIYSHSYHSSLATKKHFIVIEGDTIFTAPPLKAFKNISAQRITDITGANQIQSLIDADSTKSTNTLVFQYEMKIDVNQTSVSPEYFNLLFDVIQLINENPYLYISIEAISFNAEVDRIKEINALKSKSMMVHEFLQKNGCDCQNSILQTTFKPDLLTAENNNKYYFIIIKIFDIRK